LKGPIKKVESFKKQVLGVFLFLFTLWNHAIDFDKGIHNFMHSQRFHASLTILCIFHNFMHSQWLGLGKLE
jgi:hypothetical protein